jgi:hypothetical protein
VANVMLHVANKLVIVDGTGFGFTSVGESEQARYVARHRSVAVRSSFKTCHKAVLTEHLLTLLSSVLFLVE